MQARILVVDDDREIARIVHILLKKEGYDIVEAYDGVQALDIIEANDDIQLILLDVMMPKLNGLTTLMKIRETRNIPVIMLSAKTEQSDKVIGLSVGADDYIAKPFDASELVARVGSQLRRCMQFDAQPQDLNDKLLCVGGLELNLDSKLLRVDGIEVKLTATEFKILELLMSHPNKVFSVEHIYTSVWQEYAYSSENAVMVHIRRIRKKIEINPKDPKYLKVVWGIGYKIEK